MELGTGKGPRVLEGIQRKFHIGKPKKHIQEVNFDAGSGILPIAPGSAWMVLGKRGARHLFAYMQMKPSQLSRSYLCLEHPAQRLGANFHLSTQPWKKKRDGPAGAFHQADKGSEST